MRHAHQDLGPNTTIDGTIGREVGELVVPHHFIQATRDTGYRSLAFALAELVDNALDAQAKSIDISITEERRAGKREITIAVLDDGSGMDRASLWQSLRFGGSERFNGRESLGRYGMGLPNSSVSQAPRVDVYTWTDGASPLHAYLDVGEIAEKRRAGVGEPRHTRLPESVPRKPESGTLVQWSRCDRLRFKKASTLIRKIRRPLGRMYRLALQRGVTISVDGEPIHPVDPLFRTQVEGLPGTCERYGDPLEYRVRLPGLDASVVSAQFTELPVSRWQSLSNATKRGSGIVGGAGMSVLRGGREIAYGWHLFGAKRREHYDDWWRCELRFEPDLDELFGITSSKQGINPTPQLRAILEPDLERIARELNGRVRIAFREARPVSPHSATMQVAKRDRLLPPLRIPGGTPRAPTKGYGFRISFHEEPRPQFFNVRILDGTVQLELNRNHPFFEFLYARSHLSSSDLDLLLLAAARALLDLPSDARETFLRSWSDNLVAYLDG